MAIPLRQKGLLPLAERFPEFDGFSPDRPRSRHVYELLALAARSLRASRAQPFYSMHDVAGFFGLAVSTVADIYHELERDGLLRCKRGSMTMVPPRRPLHPRSRPRGVIAVPVWSPGFTMFANTRRFYRRLEQELWSHRMAGVNLFYNVEETGFDLVERIRRHDPDAILWLTPDDSEAEMILSLRDAGLRVVVVADRTRFAAEKYHLSWERSLQQALTCWRDQGLKNILVPGGDVPQASSSHAIHRITRLLGLKLRYVQSDLPNYATDAVERLLRMPECGFVFDDDFRLVALCATQPQEMVRLLRTRKCLVTRPVNLPLELLGDIRIDALAMDWDAVIATIAAAMADGSAFVTRQPVIFEADWLPSIPALELNRRYGVD